MCTFLKLIYKNISNTYEAMFVIRLITQSHVPSYNGSQIVLFDCSENTHFDTLLSCHIV